MKRTVSAMTLMKSTARPFKIPTFPQAGHELIHIVIHRGIHRLIHSGKARDIPHNWRTQAAGTTEAWTPAVARFAGDTGKIARYDFRPTGVSR